MTFAASAMQNPGEVFTRRWVVEVLLDLTGYTADRDLGQVSLLEPSCGSGAFLSVVLERLIASAQGHGRDLASLGDAIRAYDLQAGHVEVCRALCRDQLVAAGESVSTASALAERWVQQADFLLADMLSGIDDSPADVVIGNPPYIRYDDLADDLVALYRNTWPTMRGRGDIYIGFIERSLGMLKPGGKLGFICADRWMRNQYGEPLRELVSSRYAVEHVWTMHDVDAFEEQVSAYPAITVLGNHPQASAVVADTTAAFGASSAAALVQAVQDEAFTEFSGTGVTAHRLPHWFEGGEFWPTGSPARLALIEYLNDRFGLLDDPATGTKVSIGVASGADKVYVTKDPTVAEADRMLPLAMRRDLMSGKFEWQGNYLVNPWADDGSLVPLDDYPRMAAYLSGHPVLRERFVAKKAPRFLVPHDRQGGRQAHRHAEAPAPGHEGAHSPRPGARGPLPAPQPVLRGLGHLGHGGARGHPALPDRPGVHRGILRAHARRHAQVPGPVPQAHQGSPAGPDRRSH